MYAFIADINLVLNFAGLSNSSFGSGDGGDINIKTGAARLDNQSTIASVTNSGNGGNIKFNATDYLLLRRNSSIQTTAGFAVFGLSIVKSFSPVEECLFSILNVLK